MGSVPEPGLQLCRPLLRVGGRFMDADWGVRRQGHEDVVSAVAFNPVYPQLATSSYDGSVRFYTEEI
jgi:WD40 repeat protein